MGKGDALRLVVAAWLGSGAAVHAQAGGPGATGPCLVRLGIGRSVQGRPLELVVLGQREAIARGAPRILIVCGQHGDEPVATRAAWMVLRRLLRAADAESQTILSRVVTLVVPCANPDGAARRTRANGAGADLNRDWAHRRQPETRALLTVLARWRPQFVVDAHEWAPGDLHTANTIELPRPAGAQPAWQSEWVWPAVARCRQQGVVVRPAYWVSGSDGRLAHRYLYRVWGVPAVLYEAMPAGVATPAARVESATRFLWELLRAFAASAPPPPPPAPAPPPSPPPVLVATMLMLFLLVPFARPRVRSGARRHSGRRSPSAARLRSGDASRRASLGPALRSSGAGYVVPPKERFGARFQGGTAWQRPPGRNEAGAGRPGIR